MKIIKPIVRPYNCYNLFFVLERTFLVDERRRAANNQDDDSPPKVVAKAATGSSPASGCHWLTGYEFITLPPLPPRYRHLAGTLPPNWYDPGRNKKAKRKHDKKHGVASFLDVTRHVAERWKVIDPPTKAFIEDVASLLKRRHADLEMMNGAMVCLDVVATAASQPEYAYAPVPSKKNERTVLIVEGSREGEGESTSGPMAWLDADTTAIAAPLLPCKGNEYNKVCCIREADVSDVEIVNFYHSLSE